MLFASASLFPLVLLTKGYRVGVHNILAFFAQVTLHRTVSATSALLFLRRAFGWYDWCPILMSNRTIFFSSHKRIVTIVITIATCLLYTSDAADE